MTDQSNYLDPDARFEEIEEGNFQEHDLSAQTCWCGPKIEQLCPTCRGDDVMKLACSRCNGEGFVPEFTEDPEWPSVIVHKDATRAMLN